MEWSAECCGYPIVVQAWRAGGDLQVLITGGVCRHIGSVSVAWQTKEGVQVQDTTLPGHKDGIVGSRFAQCLAEKLGCTVAVSCGIHYDGPTPRTWSISLPALTGCWSKWLTQWKKRPADKISREHRNFCAPCLFLRNRFLPEGRFL